MQPWSFCRSQQRQVCLQQLNGMYVKNGTLIVLEGGQVKLAHNVSQVGGKQAPFRVHFAAAPGKKQVQDTVVNVADLVAATSAGTLDGEQHYCSATREACSTPRMAGTCTSLMQCQFSRARTRFRVCRLCSEGWAKQGLPYLPQAM